MKSRQQRILVLSILVTSALMYFTLFHGKKCNMKDNLLPVIYAFVDVLEAHNIDYFFDDGSLLGIWRDDGVIPFDFDIDFSIFVEDYDRVLALQHEFEAGYGFTLYGSGDFIFSKGILGLFLFSWSPYLGSSPCLRLYDQYKWIYADVYCDRLVDKEEMLRLTKWPPIGYDLPENSNRKFYCNNEPDPGCCRYEDWIKPLRRHEVAMFDRTVSLPNNVTSVLDQIFGAGNWQTPRPKGVKVVLCSSSGWWFMLLLFLVIIFLLGLFTKKAIDAEKP